MAVKITKDHVPLLMKALLALSREEVIIGIPEEAGTHAGTDLLNSQIGYLMEYGEPIANIPPRQHLGKGIDRATPEMVSAMRKGAIEGLKDVASLKTTGSAMHSALQAAGSIGAASVQKEMRTGSFTPLAESTKRARRARGNTSTKPLIDTSELHDAVSFKVRPKR